VARESLTLVQGRSYYEIDIMFERKIPARKFKSTVVERDADEQTRAQHGVGAH
jgi:SP family general alpha glucoside:H+ symporter-like MFS transporter